MYWEFFEFSSLKHFILAIHNSYILDVMFVTHFVHPIVLMTSDQMDEVLDLQMGLNND